MAAYVIVCICSCIDLALQNAVDLNVALKELNDTSLRDATVKESGKAYGFLVWMPEDSFKALGYEIKTDLSQFA